MLGNYVILEKLGQGGMGLVLKAEHRRMERLVALKVLSPKVTTSPEAVRRFQREVKAAARLEHPTSSRPTTRTKPAQAGTTNWRDWRWQTAAGAVSLPVVLLGIWVVVRDKDGKEVARVPVPEGGTVTVETAKTEASTERKSGDKAPHSKTAAPGELDMGSTEVDVAKLLEEAKATNQSSWYIERLPAEAPKHRVRTT